MKLLKKTALGLVVFAVAFVLIGFLLPSGYSVTRSATINASPEQIYPMLADLRQWPVWTVWNTERYPDMTTQYSGPNSGVGAESKWEGETSGNGTMKITKADPATGIEYTLTFEDYTPSSGYVRLSPGKSADTVEVSMGMTGDMGSNPVGRWFGLGMDSMMGSEFEQCLERLKKTVESGSAPPAETQSPKTEGAPADRGTAAEETGNRESSETPATGSPSPTE